MPTKRQPSARSWSIDVFADLEGQQHRQRPQHRQVRQRQAARRNVAARPQRAGQGREVQRPHRQRAGRQWRIELVVGEEHHHQAGQRRQCDQPVHAQPVQCGAQAGGQQHRAGQRAHHVGPDADAVVGDVHLRRHRDHPPERAPEEQQHRQRRHRLVPVVDQAQRETGERQDHRAEPHGVEEHRRADGIERQRCVFPADDVRTGREHLQRQAAEPGEGAVLAQAQPGHADAFQRPQGRRRAGRKRQRDRQGREAERQCAVGFGQQAFVATAAQEPHQAGIHQGHRERAEGQAHAVVFEHLRLQRERHQRRAEHQGAVNPGPAMLGLPDHVQQADHHVEHEEQDQERFHRREHVGAIVLRAPGRADAEGEQEAHDVEQAPAALPGNGEHRGIEHRVVAEQADVVVAAGVDQHRRQVTTEETQHRQRHVLLQHRQEGGTGDQAHDQGEGQRRWQQAVHLVGREHRQQQYADRATLQAQAEGRLALAFAETEGQRGQRGRGDRHQAVFDREREVALRRGVTQRGGDTGEQHQHADLHRHVAFGEPGFERIDQLLAEIRLARLARCVGARRRRGGGTIAIAIAGDGFIARGEACPRGGDRRLVQPRRQGVAGNRGGPAGVVHGNRWRFTMPRGRRLGRGRRCGGSRGCRRRCRRACHACRWRRGGARGRRGRRLALQAQAGQFLLEGALRPPQFQHAHEQVHQEETRHGAEYPAALAQHDAGDGADYSHDPIHAAPARDDFTQSARCPRTKTTDAGTNVRLVGFSLCAPDDRSKVSNRRQYPWSRRPPRCAHAGFRSARRAPRSR